MEKGSAAAPAMKGRVFDLSGGHPALDLVNTLDWRFRESGPEELLEDYSDVLRFIEQAGLLPSSDARKLLRSVSDSKGEKVLAEIRALREAAAELFYAVIDERTPPPSNVRRLQECLAAARQHEQLHWTGEKLAWSLPHSIADPALPLLLLSLSTNALVTSGQMNLLRQCGSEECRWLFLDTSKNHTRRWCNMKICGNRMKARRFKAQHKA